MRVFYLLLVLFCVEAQICTEDYCEFNNFGQIGINGSSGIEKIPLGGSYFNFLWKVDGVSYAIPNTTERDITIYAFSGCLSDDCATCGMVSSGTMTVVEGLAKPYVELELNNGSVTLYDEIPKLVNLMGNPFIFSTNLSSPDFVQVVEFEDEIYYHGITECDSLSFNLTCKPVFCKLFKDHSDVFIPTLGQTDGPLYNGTTGIATWEDSTNGTLYLIFNDQVAPLKSFKEVCCEGSKTPIKYCQDPGCEFVVTLSSGFFNSCFVAVTQTPILPLVIEGPGVMTCKVRQRISRDILITNSTLVSSPISYNSSIRLSKSKENCGSYNFHIRPNDNNYTLTLEFEEECHSYSINVFSDGDNCKCLVSPCTCLVESTFKILECEDGVCTMTSHFYFVDDDCLPFCGTRLGDLPDWVRWMLLGIFILVGLFILSWVIGFLFKVAQYCGFLKQLFSKRKADPNLATVYLLCILLVPFIGAQECQEIGLSQSNITECSESGCKVFVSNEFSVSPLVGNEICASYTHLGGIEDVRLRFTSLTLNYPLVHLYYSGNPLVREKCHCECPDGGSHNCALHDHPDFGFVPQGIRSFSDNSANGCTWSSFGDGHWCCGYNITNPQIFTDVRAISKSYSVKIEFDFTADISCRFEWDGRPQLFKCGTMEVNMVGLFENTFSYGGGDYLVDTFFIRDVNSQGDHDLDKYGWYQKEGIFDVDGYTNKITYNPTNCFQDAVERSSTVWDQSVKGEPVGSALSGYGVTEVSSTLLKITPYEASSLIVAIRGNLVLGIDDNLSCPKILNAAAHNSTIESDVGTIDLQFKSTCGDGLFSITLVGATLLSGCNGRVNSTMSCVLQVSYGGLENNLTICIKGLTTDCVTLDVKASEGVYTSGTVRHVTIEGGDNSGGNSGWAKWLFPVIGGFSGLLLLVIVIGACVCFVKRR